MKFKCLKLGALLGVLIAMSVAVTLMLIQVSTSSASNTLVSLPEFELDQNWPDQPKKWKLGDATSFAVDLQDNVWLLHRPRTLTGEDLESAAPPVVVFDSTGKFVKAWGGEGDGYEWPQREHFIHIDPQGYVWLSGNYCPGRALPRLQPVGDDQVLKFTQDGEFVLQIGRSNQSRGNSDVLNVHQAADAAFYAPTNELFVADGYGNHRVVVFDPDTGAFKRMWGAFGNSPVDDDRCPPPSLSSVPDGPGPEQFSIVHAIRISHDGFVYVADRENRRIQVFTTEGTFVNQLLRRSVPFARNLALSHDADQQFLYVGGGRDIVIVDRKNLEIVGSIELEGMIGSGHQIATDSKGNIYVAGSTRGVQKLVFKGMTSSPGL